MRSILYHENEFYTGTHFINENKTVIHAVRDDAEVRNYYKKYFRKDYSVFKYKVELDYNDRMKYIKYPLVSYQFKFDEIQEKINRISNTQGTFDKIINNERNVHFALFDENLSKYVSLGHVISNSELGISGVESIDTILELIEVNYK